MLQDNDPLWKAIQRFLDLFDEDSNQHGGLIRPVTIQAGDNLRLQLARDRAREAKKQREVAVS